MIKKSYFLFFVIALSLGFALLPVNIKADPSTASLKVSVQRTYAFRLGDTTIVTKTLAGQDASSSPWVKKLYNTCRTLLDIVAFALLIFIAFMNILQKDIETYAIKKMLPPAIYALILGNLGLPIFALASRVVDALMGIKMFSPINLTQIYQIIIGGEMGYGSIVFMVIAVVSYFSLSTCNCFAFCFFFLIMGVPLFGVIALNTLLSIRPIIIYLMAAVSPIAFAANILPGTQQYFKKWLGIIFPWLIFPPLVAFFFYIAKLIPGNTAVNVPLTWGFVPIILSVALPILIKAGILYLAIRLPFMLEKDITVLAATAGKAAANWGWSKGRDLGGMLYNYTDDREKAYMNQNYKAGKHQEFGRKEAEKMIDRSSYDSDEDYEKAIAPLVKSFAKKSAKDEFKNKKSNRFLYRALENNPFSVLDARNEGRELRQKKGITAGKKFSKVNATFGGRNYESAYKFDSTSSDLKDVYTTGEVLSYDPATFAKLEQKTRKEYEDAIHGKTPEEINALGGHYKTYAELRTNKEKEEFARRTLLEELRDMSTNDAGDSAYAYRWGLNARDAGQLHGINRRLWSTAGRTTARDAERAFRVVENALEGKPANTGLERETRRNFVDDIGEIEGAERPNANPVENIIAGAVTQLGGELSDRLPQAITQGLSSAKITPQLPEVRATVDRFAGTALAEMANSGLDEKTSGSLLESAAMGNFSYVESAASTYRNTGGDPNTNPFFIAIRRAAAAGYLQRSTENNIIQEIAKSDDTNTTLMIAQRLAPAVSAQGGEELVSRHLKTLVDVNAGVQVEPKVKEDMERYFSNLNLGVKVGGDFSLDPLKVQGALTAIKSPEFSINPRLAIGKATLSNGYAENIKDAIDASMANRIPDDAIVYDQTVNLRINETLRAEANVRGVELSKASMDSIEKAKTQIKDQIVAGTSAPIAVAQAFDVLVQGQPNIVRQTQQSGQPQPAAQAPNNTI